MKFFNSIILFSKITYRNNYECNIISIIKRKLLEKFDYSRLIRVRIWNSLGWPRIGINRIPATKMYSPNRRKCQSICKYSIVLPPYSRTNDNFLLRNEHSVVLHLFFHSVRNSASKHLYDDFFALRRIFETGSFTAREECLSRHHYYDD